MRRTSMGATINGRDETVLVIEELTNVVRKNSEVTSEQSEKLVSYTRWLVFLTVAIGLIALAQIIVPLCGK
jgi:hypothetical protein